MSALNSRGMLTMVTRQLQSRWSETCDSWRDKKAADFEDLYLAELDASVGTALRALEELDQLLAKIHADCD